MIRFSVHVCTFFAALAAASLSAAEAQRPNIIFLMADDLGYGDVGCYGQTQISTPHIDRMASEGVRFTDFYAGSTVCAPSRCVLMTGLHMGHCFIRGNSKDNLRPEDITIAKLLKSAGYTCGMFGKWGLGHEGSTGLPTDQGFDEFVGYLDQHHAHNYFPMFLVAGDSRLPLPNVVPDVGEFGQGVATERRKYSHDVIFDAALEFLDKHHDEPFFLYLPFTLPHANNEARDKGMEIPSYGPYADRDWPDAEKGFAAMVSRVDQDLGVVLEKLKKYQIDDQTIVFFTSDNGPHKEGGQDPDFFDSNGPLRGIKRDLYEGGIRVPMIVRWPGHTQPGTLSHDVAYLGDVMATCCALAGVPVPPGRDSISFLPAILGRQQEQQRHEYLYWEFYERGFKQAVRQGEWKYVKINHDEELYNLHDDLGEQHNLAQENPQKLAQLRALAEQAHVPSPNWQVQIPERKQK